MFGSAIYDVFCLVFVKFCLGWLVVSALICGLVGSGFDSRSLLFSFSVLIFRFSVFAVLRSLVRFYDPRFGL